jgi:hypothetical protein
MLVPAALLVPAIPLKGFCGWTQAAERLLPLLPLLLLPSCQPISLGVLLLLLLLQMQAVEQMGALLQALLLVAGSKEVALTAALLLLLLLSLLFQPALFAPLHLLLLPAVLSDQLCCI